VEDANDDHAVLVLADSRRETEDTHIGKQSPLDEPPFVTNTVR